MLVGCSDGYLYSGGVFSGPSGLQTLFSSYPGVSFRNCSNIMANPTSSSNPPRVLLTGATGFVGGSVLTQLLGSTSPSLRSAPITCLVRGAGRAAKLKAAYGERVNLVLYSKSFSIHFPYSFPVILEPQFFHRIRAYVTQ